MFQPFCFNDIITDLSFIHKKINYKAGLTKFRAIEHILTRMQAVARIFASTHVICEQFEQMPNFAGTSFQINENIRYPSFCPRML